MICTETIFWHPLAPQIMSVFARRAFPPPKGTTLRELQNGSQSLKKGKKHNSCIDVNTEPMWILQKQVDEQCDNKKPQKM